MVSSRLVSAAIGCKRSFAVKNNWSVAGMSHDGDWIKKIIYTYICVCVYFTYSADMFRRYQIYYNYIWFRGWTAAEWIAKVICRILNDSKRNKSASNSCSKLLKKKKKKLLVFLKPYSSSILTRLPCHHYNRSRTDSVSTIVLQTV